MRKAWLYEQKVRPKDAVEAIYLSKRSAAAISRRVHLFERRDNWVVEYIKSGRVCDARYRIEPTFSWNRVCKSAESKFEGSDEGILVK